VWEVRGVQGCNTESMGLDRTGTVSQCECTVCVVLWSLVSGAFVNQELVGLPEELVGLNSEVPIPN